MSDQSKKLFNGITNIDDDLIEAALASKGAPKRKKKTNVYKIYRWGSIAAAAVCFIVLGIVLVPKIMDRGKGYSNDAAYFEPNKHHFSSTETVETAEAGGSSAQSSNKSESSTMTNSATGNECADSMAADAAPIEAEASSSNEITAGDNVEAVIEEVVIEEALTLEYEYEDISFAILRREPGTDMFMTEKAISDVTELVTSLGTLTRSNAKADAIGLTLTLMVRDGADREITISLPYVWVDGSLYESEHGRKAIEELNDYLEEYYRENQ